MLESISLFYYEEWYKNDVSPNLDYETKLKVAKKISELSQKEPIWTPNLHYSHNKFPELAPFSNTGNFTGMQLYATLTEITKELGAIKTKSASEIAQEM